MVDQWKARVDREDYRAGMVASILVNVNRKKGSQKCKPMDFFKPSKQSDEPQLDHDDPNQARSEFFQWVTDNSKGGVIVTKS